MIAHACSGPPGSLAGALEGGTCIEHAESRATYVSSLGGPLGGLRDGLMLRSSALDVQHELNKTHAPICAVLTVTEARETKFDQCTNSPFAAKDLAHHVIARSMAMST